MWKVINSRVKALPFFLSLSLPFHSASMYCCGLASWEGGWKAEFGEQAVEGVSLHQHAWKGGTEAGEGRTADSYSPPHRVLQSQICSSSVSWVGPMLDLHQPKDAASLGRAV